MSSIRPLEAQSVLGALVQAVNDALARLPGAPWRCLRAMPRIDGSLYFDLEKGRERIQLNWLGPVNEKAGRAGKAGNRPALAFSSDKPFSSHRHIRLLRTIRAVLAKISDRADFVLLRFCNRDQQILRFDDQVVDLLLAGRIASNQTSWFGYRFRDAFLERADSIRLTFLGSESGPVGFEVRPDRPPIDEDKLIMRNGLLALYLVEDSRDPKLRGQVVHQVERFIGFLLSRSVHSGMSLDGTSPSTAPSFRYPISTSRWGNPYQWFQFFSDFEIQRSNVCSICFADPISWVTHGEAECRWVEPADAHPKPMVYYSLPFECLPSRDVRGSASFPTTIVESDAVLGGSGKFQDALDRACRQPDIRMVCVNTTCLPKIIGDDVPSMIARTRRLSPVPILSLNTDLTSPDSTFQDLIRQARDQAKASGDATAERTGLNLLGFPATRGRQELIGTLGELGIPINVCLLPKIGIDLFERYLRGRQGVVYPQGFWVKVVQELLSNDIVLWKVLPSPCGLLKTLGWLQWLAEAFGRLDELEGWKRQHLPDFQENWEHWRQKARNLGLAFVVDQESALNLIDATRFYGVDILNVLGEMGFNLHVLMYQSEFVPARNSELESLLQASLPFPERFSLRFFASPAELSECLREGRFDAVYSEVVFDTRISRAGKARFDLSMIELGLPGALRSIARLVDLCEWGFYRRYAMFLTEAGRESRT